MDVVNNTWDKCSRLKESFENVNVHQDLTLDQMSTVKNEPITTSSCGFEIKIESEVDIDTELENSAHLNNINQDEESDEERNQENIPYETVDIKEEVYESEDDNVEQLDQAEDEICPNMRVGCVKDEQEMDYEWNETEVNKPDPLALNDVETGYLVKFVKDGVYHICAKRHIKFEEEEEGLVLLKCKGIYFRAIVVIEGKKDFLQSFQNKCVRNDELLAKYKFNSNNAQPSTSQFSREHHDVSTVLTSIAVGKSNKSFNDGTSIPDQILPETSVNQSCHHINKDTENLNSPNVIPHKNIELHPSEDDLEMNQTKKPAGEQCLMKNETVVPRRKNHANPQTKQHYCPYCQTLYTKFARHLFQKHAVEKQVKMIINLPPFHKERRRVIASLRAKGDKIFNSLIDSTTKVILPRRKEYKKENYISCHLCGNLYKTRFLYRHIKRCPNSDGLIHRSVLKYAKSVALKEEIESANTIPYLADVLSGIQTGEIRNIIEKDPLIIKYTCYLCTLYGQNHHVINLIRRKLRQVATLLVEIKKIDSEIKLLSDIFQLKKISVIFSAIKIVANFKDGKFGKPSVALAVSPCLQACGNRLMNLAEKNDDEKQIKTLTRWLQCFKKKYNTLIAKITKQIKKTNSK